MKKIMKIPKYAQAVAQTLEKAGFEAFLVGGCVRDLLSGETPKDWDFATNAKPEEIMLIFPDGKYENDFGTVLLPIKYLTHQPLETKTETGVIEITTYRIESRYTDRRHPDEVKFAKTLKEDLSRRDFTVNAMAIKLLSSKLEDTNEKFFEIEESDFEIVDLFGGREDLKNKLIRAVGDAKERFDEDALRMMRAVRFCVQLGFSIEEKTFLAIQENAKNLDFISRERIRDELQKIILSKKPALGIELLHKTHLLKYIIPEIEEGFDVTQSHHHYYGPYNTVFKHLVASLEKCPSEKLEVRLASLFHDIGKPLTKRGRGENATFYNHEYAGAKMTQKIMERLKFPRAIQDKVVLLVRNHMFYYNVDEVGEAGVRRVVRKVGAENINDLIDVRIADRLGSGVPKAIPYKLRHFKFMVEKVSQDPISVKQLKLNGHDLMKELGLEPGPKIGAILDVLLSAVLDDPQKNQRDILLELAEKLSQENLADLRKKAKAKIEEEKEEEERLMKKKYWVE